MPILFCSLELYLPYCHSLKEKRRVVKGTAQRLRSKFNVSVGEIGHQDLWQRARLGIVCVGSSRLVLDQTSQKLIQESHHILGGDLVDHYIEILEHE